MCVLIVYVARKAVGAALGKLGVLDRHPYAQSLAASQFALAVGLLIGLALDRGDVEEIASVLAAAGLLGCAAGFTGLLLRALLPATERVKRTTGDELFGLLGFLLLMLCGQTMRRGEPYDQALVNWLMAFTVTAPLWGLIFVRVSSGWLLRPFDVRDATCDDHPSEVLSFLKQLSYSLFYASPCCRIFVKGVEQEYCGFSVLCLVNLLHGVFSELEQAKI